MLLLARFREAERRHVPSVGPSPALRGEARGISGSPGLGDLQSWWELTLRDKGTVQNFCASWCGCRRSKDACGWGGLGAECQGPGAGGQLSLQKSMGLTCTGDHMGRGALPPGLESGLRRSVSGEQSDGCAETVSSRPVMWQLRRQEGARLKRSGVLGPRAVLGGGSAGCACPLSELRGRSWG